MNTENLILWKMILYDWLTDLLPTWFLKLCFVYSIRVGLRINNNIIEILYYFFENLICPSYFLADIANLDVYLFSW